MRRSTRPAMRARGVMETPFLLLRVLGWGKFGWVMSGLGVQTLFTARFLLHWIQSEPAGRSNIPLAFWSLSLAGGLMLLTYALWRGDPEFILGQSMGVFVYLRNLWLIHNEKRASS